MGDKGEQLGIMPLYQAREVAKSRNLDLVEVAATAEPPVCRLLDYGKYKYEQARREREARKSQKVALLREVRIRPKIGAHDLMIGATAITNNFSIATFNLRHFNKIEGLKLEVSDSHRQ